MNPFFTYDNQFLWERHAWDPLVGPANTLLRWAIREGLYRVEGAAHPETLPEGTWPHPRLQCHMFPEELRYWAEKGMEVIPGHAGDHWMILIPDEVKNGAVHDPKVLTVVRECDTSSPFWAMDTLALYRNYCELAAKERLLLEFIVTHGTQRIDLAILIMREIAHRYNLSYDNLYLDITRLKAAGRRLSEIPGFKLEGVDDPDAAVEALGEGVLALYFGQNWITRESLEFANFTPGRIGDLPFNYERLIHSQIGKAMADAMRLEYDYSSGEDDGLQKQLRQLGLRYCYREENNRGWLVLVPENAFAEPGKRLPCMLILQEIVKADAHSIPSALSMWYEYLRIAAQGDLMLLFFVLEDAESNELLLDILQKTEKEFPFLNPERVFVTGHSHNGYFALEFACRHPELLAGVATLGNGHGLKDEHCEPPVTQSHLDTLRRADLPLINIDGQWENQYATRGLRLPFGGVLTDEQRLRYWKNRLYAWNCPAQSDEVILSAPENADPVIRRLGVPVDRSETRYFEGDECWIGDVVNAKGRAHLRLVTVENLPHALSAHMPWLCWDYLRHFKRDKETGMILDI